MKAPLPQDEPDRLEALRAYSILDTLDEQAFNDIALLAGSICETPIALISLVDEQRQWFKARVGLQARETPRDFAFCAHAILDAQNVLVVKDARADPRFEDNPLVTGDPNIRFYAGAPLLTPTGKALGTVCVVDRTPRDLPPEKIEALRALSRMVVAQLELRRVVSELQRSEEQLELALSASKLALFDWDVKSGEIALSAEWSGIVGGPPQAIRTTARALQTLTHPDDAPALTGLVRALLRGELHYYAMEHRIQTNKGEWTWIISRAQVVERDDSGRALRVIGTNSDINERKAIERIKDEFISTASHELRTPLTAVGVSLGLLKDGSAGPLSEDARQLVDVAAKNSDRLAALVDDLLDLERARTGKMELELKPVELEALLMRALTLNAPYAQRFDVRFRLDSDPTLQAIADPDRLMQVLTNLLSNAAKFSPRGSEVLLQTRARSDTVVFSVIDKGRGIPAEFHARIFEKFSQVDSSDSRQKGGTGLGLSICKNLVEAMAGRIWLESTPGTGTSFHFELPRAGAN